MLLSALGLLALMIAFPVIDAPVEVAKVTAVVQSVEEVRLCSKGDCRDRRYVRVTLEGGADAKAWWPDGLASPAPGDRVPLRVERHRLTGALTCRLDRALWTNMGHRPIMEREQ